MKPLIVRFDGTLTDYTQRLPAAFQPLMSGVTHLGDPVVILVIALAGSTVSSRYNQHRVAAAFAAAVLLSALSYLLKQFLHRTRPDTLYVTAMSFKSYSFPSFHAYSATVLYGLLAYLAYLHLPRPWGLFAAIFLGLVIFLVGVSRVYLGAHFPTDVLGGWLLGILSLYVLKRFILSGL